jgi:hypothetical protein
VLLSDGCFPQGVDRGAGTFVGSIGLGLVGREAGGKGVALGGVVEYALASGSVVVVGRVGLSVELNLVFVGLVSAESLEATFF